MGGLKQARCVSNKEMSAWAIHMGSRLTLGNPASNKPAKDEAIQSIVVYSGFMTSAWSKGTFNPLSGLCEHHWRDFVSFFICANSNLRLALNPHRLEVFYPRPIILDYADNIAICFVFLSCLVIVSVFRICLVLSRAVGCSHPTTFLIPSMARL